MLETGPAEAIVLAFDREIYPRAAVEQGIAAFSRAGALEIVDSGEYHVVRVSPAPGVSADALRGELGNYVLAAAIVRAERRLAPGGA